MTTFGIELEIVPQAGFEVGFKARVCQHLTQIGLQTINNSYMGRAYSVWQVKDDCTVRVRRNGREYHGCEVVSPVLQYGADALQTIKNVCEAIERAGGTANVSCGMHIHVGLQERTADNVKNIVRAYGHFTNEIDSVLPRSRRATGTASRWCRPVFNAINRTRFLQRLDSCSSVGQIDQLIKGYNGRYSALSLAAYTRIGTVEFRQHSGTCDAAKVAFWATWCVNFVERFSNVNVLEQAQPAANAGNIVETVTGRGNSRLPSRKCPTRSVLLHMMAGACLTDANLCHYLGNDHGTNAASWIKILARTWGHTFVRNAEGSWLLASACGVEQTETVEPFRACFDLAEGLLGFYGRRRSALA